MAKSFLRSQRAKKRKAAIADLSSIARQEIDRGLDRVEKALVASHKRVVKDWDSDVTFIAKRIVTPTRIRIIIVPRGEDAEVWYYVDRGTKPHEIRAKNAPRLAFMMTLKGGKPARGGYVPKTLAKPARTVAGGGYVKSPKTLVQPVAVQHPGNEGRKFTEQIAEDGKPDYKREMENAFRRAARRVEE
jgi:hypothetical protein